MNHHIRGNSEVAHGLNVHGRVRHANGDDTAAVSFSSGGRLADRCGSDLDVAHSRQHCSHADHELDRRRRCQIGGHGRDLHNSARSVAGVGARRAVSRVWRLEHRCNSRRRLAMNRDNSDIASRPKLGRLRHRCAHRGIERRLGVQHRDRHPAATGAIVGGVCVGPRVGFDGDVGGHRHDATDPGVHRGFRGGSHVGHTHLHEATAAGIGTSHRPIVGDRSNHHVRCAGSATVDACHVAEQQCFGGALVDSGGCAVLNVYGAASVIDRVGKG